jgi:ferredoxin
MIIGSKLARAAKMPVLHLEADREKCVSCGKCTRECPMSLEVQDMVKGGKMNSAECILCGECVDGCPKKAINYSFRNKSCYCRKN